MCGCGGYNPRLMSGRVPNIKPYLRRIPGGDVFYPNGPHEQDWIRACKESPESRTEGTSNFAYAGPFNEMVMLGVLAVRLQGLNKALEWDGEISQTEELKIMITDDFKVVDGHPSFDKKYETFNALDSANSYIKHTYRTGWSLPAMP
jgi:hypothetical protein